MIATIDKESIQVEIRELYAKAAYKVDGLFCYQTGKDGAKALQYDAIFINTAPTHLINGFCGIGNPFSLGSINEGELVFDVGCGIGFDVYCASHLVGEKGKVCGIDITPEMKKQAELNLGKAGITNATVALADSENIPFENNTFDVVISNGVLNLSTDKKKSFTHIFRVLKPGGRFQFADIIIKDNAPLEEITPKKWSK